MPIRNILTIVVAIVFGLIAVILVRNYMSNAAPRGAATATNTVASIPVVIAAQPIARGVALQPSLLKVVNYPEGSVPAGSYQTIDALASSDKQTQRLALSSIVANEPILPGKISEQGGRLNLAVVLKDGMRAVSLRSNDVAGVAGFVLPGDHVDILLTREMGGEANKVTQVLAENVLVLGIDQSDNQEVDKPVVAKAVTVEVTPEQAQDISLAQTVGELSFALRHVADDAKSERQITTVSDLNVGHEPGRPVVRGPAAPEINVTRGVSIERYRALGSAFAPTVQPKAIVSAVGAP